VFKGGKVHKVPSTPAEAVASSLVGFFEKKRLRVWICTSIARSSSTSVYLMLTALFDDFFSSQDFVVYVSEFDPTDPKTAKGRNLQTMSSRELLKDYSFDEGTVDFIGHAMALYSTDEYLGLPAIQLVMRIKLYQDSLLRFMSNGVKSPYIYPLYGLGELPQGFARLSAVYGGTFMLNRPVDRIVYDAEGRACGVISQGEYAKCKSIVADPSYFAETEPAKVKVTSTVVRAIAILSHPITDSKDESCQIIIPQKQVGRRSDIYVFLAGSSFNICPAGRFLAFVSTTKEKATPQEDLAEGVKLLGKVDHIVFDQYDVMEPSGSGERDGCFISKSYDASSHFEETSADCMDIYRRLTGTPLDLTKSVVSSLGGDQ
jgi:Rab GDP dissociation inhibitor